MYYPERYISGRHLGAHDPKTYFEPCACTQGMQTAVGHCPGHRRGRQDGTLPPPLQLPTAGVQPRGREQMRGQCHLRRSLTPPNLFPNLMLRESLSSEQFCLTPYLLESNLCLMGRPRSVQVAQEPLLTSRYTPGSNAYPTGSATAAASTASQPIPNISAVGDLFEPVANAGQGTGGPQGTGMQYPILPAWSRQRTHLTGECLMQVREGTRRSIVETRA